jgi:hypothetical protein
MFLFSSTSFFVPRCSMCPLWRRWCGTTARTETEKRCLLAVRQQGAGRQADNLLRPWGGRESQQIGVQADSLTIYSVANRNQRLLIFSLSPSHQFLADCMKY